MTIKAKYATTCTVCRKAIARGAEMVYDHARREGRHAGCIPAETVYECGRCHGAVRRSECTTVTTAQGIAVVHVGECPAAPAPAPTCGADRAIKTGRF